MVKQPRGLSILRLTTGTGGTGARVGCPVARAHTHTTHGRQQWKRHGARGRLVRSGPVRAGGVDGRGRGKGLRRGWWSPSGGGRRPPFASGAPGSRPCASGSPCRGPSWRGIAVGLPGGTGITGGLPPWTRLARLRCVRWPGHKCRWKICGKERGVVGDEWMDALHGEQPPGYAWHRHQGSPPDGIRSPGFLLTAKMWRAMGGRGPKLLPV